MATYFMQNATRLVARNNAIRRMATNNKKMQLKKQTVLSLNFSNNSSSSSSSSSNSRCNYRILPSFTVTTQTTTFQQQRYFHNTNFSMEENTEEIKIITPDSPPDPKVEQILEDILSLNLLQVAQLAEGMKDKLGIQDTPMPMMGGGMPMMAAGGAAAPAEDAEPAEEKTAFDVKLTSFDASSKIKVIKEVRAITGLGLKEAKEFVEGAPKVIKEGLKKEECEEIQEKLKAVGGVVEIE